MASAAETGFAALRILVVENQCMSLRPPTWAGPRHVGRGAHHVAALRRSGGRYLERGRAQGGSLAGYSSVASSVMAAFRTLETGQPALALPAISSNAAGAMPGTFARSTR